jgi:hypothetical protein
MITARARRCWVCAAVVLAFLDACAVDQPGPVLGTGGVGVIQYSTTDPTTPGYWASEPRGMSDYIGAGGDSVQPDLQPRPALHADRVVRVGDSEIASLAVDWPSRTAEVRIAPLAAPNEASSLADLTQHAGQGELDGDGGTFFRRFEGASLHAHGSDLVVVIPAPSGAEVLLYETRGGLELAASTTLPFGIESGYFVSSEIRSPPVGWPRAALIGDALVFQARDHGSVTFEVVDLGTRGQIRHIASVKRGKALAAGPLREIAGMAVSERRVETPGKGGEYSFLLDRLDVTEPNAPVHLRSLNVPGPVIAATADAQRLISVGFERAVVKGVTTCCPGGGGCGAMIDTCEVTRERLSLVEVTGDAANTVDTLIPEKPLGFNAVEPNALGAFGAGTSSYDAELVAITGIDSHNLEVVRQPVEATTGGYQSPFMAANGAYVAIPTDYGAGVAVASATPDGAFGAPRVTAFVPEPGELFGPAVSDLLMTDAELFVASGSHGIVTLPLEP